MRFIYSPLALIISAFLTGLAHQPLHLGWFAWFSLIPLIFVLNQQERSKDLIKEVKDVIKNHGNKIHTLKKSPWRRFMNKLTEIF